METNHKQLQELSNQEKSIINGGSLDITVRIFLTVLSKPFTLWV